MNNAANVVDGTYVSVWDTFREVISKCKINLISKEVYDIEPNDTDASVFECFTDEFVTIDGKKYGVCPENMSDGSEFWYRW